MRLTHLFAGALIVLVSAAARADTYETFNLNATAGASDYTISGTLTFDTTTDSFTNSNLSTPFGYITGAPTVTAEYPNYTSPTLFVDGFGTWGTNTYVLIGIEATTLSGYTGGNVCSTTSACTGGRSSYLDVPDPLTTVDSYQLNSGAALTLDPTPEPSSLILLATGLLIAAGLMRRRRFV